MITAALTATGILYRWHALPTACRLLLPLPAAGAAQNGAGAALQAVQAGEQGVGENIEAAWPSGCGPVVVAQWLWPGGGGGAAPMLLANWPPCHFDPAAHTACASSTAENALAVCCVLRRSRQMAHLLNVWISTPSA